MVVPSLVQFDGSGIVDGNWRVKMYTHLETFSRLNPHPPELGPGDEDGLNQGTSSYTQGGKSRLRRRLNQEQKRKMQL